MKVAVISDLHANATALKASLRCIDEESVDLVVVLGDLLTYGCDIEETLDILHSLMNRYKTVFIKGNHDQIYFDLQSGLPYQYKPFPEFISESVEYTAIKLSCTLENLFPWQDSALIENLYFAHANAFGYKDWRYVNSDDDLVENAKILLNKQISGAVFGHTHRAKIYFSDGKKVVTPQQNGDSIDFFRSDGKLTCIANSGSLGQPRGSQASFLIIDCHTDDIVYSLNYLEYCLNTHKNSISKSCLSEQTKSKLLSFYT